MKLSKVFIVPSSSLTFADAKIEIALFLAECIPEWCDIQVVEVAKFLGIMMGKKAGALSWEAPIGEWISRSYAIGRSGASIRTAVSAYNRLSIPVLSYVAQISVPPVKLLVRKQLSILAVLLRLPYCCVNGAICSCLAEAGLPRIRLALESCLAALVRAATVTLSWRSSLATIRASVNETNIPELDLLRGIFWDKSWDSPAFASTLCWAASGMPCVGFGQELLSVQRALDKSGLARRRSLEHGCAAGLRCVGEAQLAYSSQGSRSILPVLSGDAKGGGPIRQSMPAVRVQALFYSAFVGSREKALGPTIKHRLLTNFELVVDDSTIARFMEFSLRVLTPHSAFPIWRTLLHGWCTSYRMHTVPRDQCLLGCNAPDSLSHYITCSAVWEVIDAVVGFRSISVHDRLGLALSPDAVHALCVACMAYHAARKKHRLTLLALREAGSPQDIRSLWLRLVEASDIFYAESRVANWERAWSIGSSATGFR